MLQLIIGAVFAAFSWTTAQAGGGHFETSGLLLRQQGTTLVRIFEGVVDGQLSVPAGGNTGRIDVSFLDENEAEQPEPGSEFTLDHLGPNPVIATFTQVDDWAFEITGNAQGVTSLQISVFHAGHADWTSPPIQVRVLGATGAPDAALVLEQVRLHPATPNPFIGATTLRYVLPAASQVQLSVVDVRGRAVASLFEGPRDAGEYAATWSPGGLVAGVYFVRLVANGIVRTRALTLMN